MTNLFLLGGCWILAVVLAFHRIGSQSFWLDEAFSVAVAQRSLPEVWGIITSDQANMALYYLLLHWWLPLGQDEAAIRSLSALCTTLAVVPLWALGRQLADHWTTSLAAVLFSTNAFLVARAAQEARGYGLTVLVTTSAAYLFVRAIDRDSTRAWAAYTVVGALAMYTHYFAVWVLLAHFIAGMAHSKRRRAVLLSHMAMIPLVAPLIVPVFTTHHIEWVPPLTLNRLISGLVDLAGRGGRPLLIAYVLACALALLAPTRRGDGNEAKAMWGRWFLVSWLATPMVATLLFSLRRPIFVPYYLLICIPPAALLAATGIMSLRAIWLRAAAAGVLTGLAAIALRDWYEGRYLKEDWRGASALVLTQAEPGDGIIFEAPYVRVAFEYYLKRAPAKRGMLTPVFPSTPWHSWGQPSLARSRFGDNPVSDEDGRRRLWVIVSRAPVKGTEPGAVWRPAALERKQCRADERQFHLVRVIRYEPGPCTGPRAETTSRDSLMDPGTR
jgi:mannosyltransferase